MTAGWDWSYPYPSQPLPDGSDLMQRLQQAEHTIRRLEERLRQAEKQLEELRAKPPLHVEYHFDQLKVNELKGTLNVGLSPQGVQGIDAFEAPPGLWSIPPGDQADGEPIPQLQQQMRDYVDREGPAILTDLEQERGMALDETHRLRLLADIKNQLNERVHYYGKTTPYPKSGPEQQQLTWKQSVTDRTVRDIKAALAGYLDKWKFNANVGGGESR